MAPEVIKVALNQQTNAEVAEFIRNNFIVAMRNGDRLCYDIDSTTPDWANYIVEGTFVPDHFFNYEHMTVEANYMPYVRENENHGIGGVNPGFGYARSDKFAMIIRCAVETEEELQAVTSKIPHFNEQFQHVIFE